jgi:acetate kinase
MKILVLNAGSSSQKSCLYEIGSALSEAPPTPLWEGKLDVHADTAELRVKNARGTRVQETLHVQAGSAPVGELLEKLWSDKAKEAGAPEAVNLVAHRIVNGGANHRDPVVITKQVKDAIAHMIPFAPLHNASGLAGIEFAENKFGSVKQVAVFDTGFHKTLPDAASIYAGPYEWVAQGIRRLGFHGINYQYCSERAAAMLGRTGRPLRLVICHLGNGCSLAAVRDGRSVDTTMGFTPMEGLVMGTRSGSIDPGILTYLARNGTSGAQLDELLNKKSGLLGISGTSGDMREIVQKMKAGDARARLAFDIFVHRLRSMIGAMAASAGGIDVLVFTAGIGENSPDVRAAACADFGYLSLELDAEKNTAESSEDRDIASAKSAARILVIGAQEDWMIAKQAWTLVTSSDAATG